jgi:hypothetical protein
MKTATDMPAVRLQSGYALLGAEILTQDHGIEADFLATQHQHSARLQQQNEQ